MIKTRAKMVTVVGKLNKVCAKLSVYENHSFCFLPGRSIYFRYFFFPPTVATKHSKYYFCFFCVSDILTRFIQIVLLIMRLSCVLFPYHMRMKQEPFHKFQNFQKFQKLKKKKNQKFHKKKIVNF